MKQLKLKGNNESFEGSPPQRGNKDENSMILTGGAPIEPSIMMTETPIKKGPHYP
jgi:hypothetical protein